MLESIGKTEFKAESSAKWVDIYKHWTGSLRIQIQHDTIKDVTPEMMKWWFENLGKTVTWNGEEVSLYHLWHHRDHIAITPLTNPKNKTNKGFAVGAFSLIEEQFNDFHERISARVYTTKLDETEFTFLIKKWGLTVGDIKHYYSPSKDGIDFYAETLIGINIPLLGWVINWLVLPFIYSKQTAENWIRHNIEETGQSEKVIPYLYSSRNGD
ncbi:hypothetical protein EHQ53_13505 [Leptospira langatensis]|uniref:DAPG hydrolase PhiG domain-containing protein n=1 Tax=Leptospira langatensis TaxID=2484983 RepID=A0A5F1ZR95_9LEPT|nr:hypothetical protein [Leptospira langatensis]TGK02617.1 hypothetical protein EHO57_04605 [Leptospira langatensis]TGL40181.1 hypothetical protein EHQ53_13505 [Leptospira langatensis]